MSLVVSGGREQRSRSARPSRQLVRSAGVAEDRPMSSRPRPHRIGFVGLGLLAAFAGCRKTGEAPVSAGGEASPSIVLVLVDQLRKDAADRWMPEVRALADKGVVFENMRSAAPW